jgi:hypothetical protein
MIRLFLKICFIFVTLFSFIGCSTHNSLAGDEQASLTSTPKEDMKGFKKVLDDWLYPKVTLKTQKDTQIITKDDVIDGKWSKNFTYTTKKGLELTVDCGRRASHTGGQITFYFYNMKTNRSINQWIKNAGNLVTCGENAQFDLSHIPDSVKNVSLYIRYISMGFADYNRLPDIKFVK